MHPDLVGASGFQPAKHVGMAAVTGNHLPVSDGGTAVPGIYGHPFPVDAVAADGGVHGAPVLPQTAHTNRLVLPRQGVVLKLRGQGQVGRVIFGRDDQAGGVAVDAVDNAWAQGSVDSGE